MPPSRVSERISKAGDPGLVGRVRPGRTIDARTSASSVASMLLRASAMTIALLKHEAELAGIAPPSEWTPFYRNSQARGDACRQMIKPRYLQWRAIGADWTTAPTEAL